MKNQIILSSLVLISCPAPGAQPKETAAAAPVNHVLAGIHEELRALKPGELGCLKSAIANSQAANEALAHAQSTQPTSASTYDAAAAVKCHKNLAQIVADFENSQQSTKK